MIKLFRVTVSYSDGRTWSQIFKSYTSGDAICSFLLNLGFNQMEGIKDIKAVEDVL